MANYLNLDDEIAEIEREIRILTQQLKELVNSLAFLVGGSCVAPLLISWVPQLFGFYVPMSPSYLRLSPAETSAMSPLAVRLVQAAGNDMCAADMAKPLPEHGQATTAALKQLDSIRMYSMLEDTLSVTATTTDSSAIAGSPSRWRGTRACAIPRSGPQLAAAVAGSDIHVACK